MKNAVTELKTLSQIRAGRVQKQANVKTKNWKTSNQHLINIVQRWKTINLKLLHTKNFNVTVSSNGQSAIFFFTLEKSPLNSTLLNRKLLISRKAKLSCLSADQKIDINLKRT